MKLTKSSVAILALLLATTAAQAQMYKWVGPDGKVNYTDTPPPKSAKSVAQKNLGGEGSDASNLPYELAEAVRNSPVTLYTTGKCAPCDDGRAFLNKRGIPFKEKTVSSNDDQSRFQQITGEKQFPVLMVGRSKQAGYEAGAWGSALSAAGYPETSMLPKTYRNAAAESVVPKAAEPNSNSESSNASATATAAESLPPPTGNAPPGFRF